MLVPLTVEYRTFQQHEQLVLLHQPPDFFLTKQNQFYLLTHYKYKHALLTQTQKLV